MSTLIVITFDDPDEAGKVRDAIRRGQHQDQIKLDDSAIVVRDEDGKVHVKNELDRGVKIGAVGGGLLGLLIGGLFFPIGGLLLGVLGGMGVGALADLGVQKSFVKEIKEKLQPGTSAIFLILREANPNAVVAAMKPYKGEVYHTSLDPEDEDTLRRVLEKRQ